MGTGALRTNLVIYYRFADIFSQAGKPVYILSAVQESRDLPLFCQRDEVLENFVQLPGNSHTSVRFTTLETVGLPFDDRPPPFLLGLTLRNRRAERLCQAFDPGHQRFYRSATSNRLLGRP